MSDGGEVLVDGGVEPALRLENFVVVPLAAPELLQLLLRLQTQLRVGVLDKCREQEPPCKVVLSLLEIYYIII